MTRGTNLRSKGQRSRSLRTKSKNCFSRISSSKRSSANSRLRFAIFGDVCKYAGARLHVTAAPGRAPTCSANFCLSYTMYLVYNRSILSAVQPIHNTQIFLLDHVRLSAVDESQILLLVMRYSVDRKTLAYSLESLSLWALIGSCERQ